MMLLLKLLALHASSLSGQARGKQPRLACRAASQSYTAESWALQLCHLHEPWGMQTQTWV